MAYIQKTLTFNIPDQILELLGVNIDELISELAKYQGWSEENGTAEDFIKDQITDQVLTPIIIKLVEQKKKEEMMQIQQGITQAIQQAKNEN